MPSLKKKPICERCTLQIADTLLLLLFNHLPIFKDTSKVSGVYRYTQVRNSNFVWGKFKPGAWKTKLKHAYYKNRVLMRVGRQGYKMSKGDIPSKEEFKLVKKVQRRGNMHFASKIFRTLFAQRSAGEVCIGVLNNPNVKKHICNHSSELSN